MDCTEALYNLKGALDSIDDLVFFLAWPVDVSEAPEAFLVSFDAAVVIPGGTGVFDPEGVLVLAELVGVLNPVGVLGLEVELPLATVTFLALPVGVARRFVLLVVILL